MYLLVSMGFIDLAVANLLKLFLAKILVLLERVLHIVQHFNILRC